ncbi:MAG: NADPH:quinone reductase [Rhodobacteraceae bacterium]|nr:NADPH:quinone reductase [Paracoccaceae bacterium]
MRAAFYRRTGPAREVLEIGTLPEPRPATGEVLVRVHASGINPADVKRRAGWGGLAMADDLVVPHCDGAGVIEAVGDGVSADRIGARVWLFNAQGAYTGAGRAFGTAAERIAIPEAQAVDLAEPFTFEQGACLGVPAMTAHRCVFADGPVAGQTLLVQGGAGAVGHLAVQMARLGGARVLTTVSHAEGAAHAAAAGAHAIIQRHTDDVIARVRGLTEGRGVDRVIEVDLAANMATDAELLVENGTIASYSCSSDPRPVLPYYAFASKGLNLRFIQGFNIPPAARCAAIAFIGQHAQHLQVAVGARFPLERIADAHARVEGSGLGNTVVRIGSGGGAPPSG